MKKVFLAAGSVLLLFLIEAALFFAAIIGIPALILLGRDLDFKKVQEIPMAENYIACGSQSMARGNEIVRYEALLEAEFKERGLPRGGRHEVLGLVYDSRILCVWREYAGDADERQIVRAYCAAIDPYTQETDILLQVLPQDAGTDSFSSFYFFGSNAGYYALRAGKGGEDADRSFYWVLDRETDALVAAAEDVSAFGAFGEMPPYREEGIYREDPAVFRAGGREYALTVVREDGADEDGYSRLEIAADGYAWTIDPHYMEENVAAYRAIADRYYNQYGEGFRVQNTFVYRDELYLSVFYRRELHGYSMPLSVYKLDVQAKTAEYICTSPDDDAASSVTLLYAAEA